MKSTRSGFKEVIAGCMWHGRRSLQGPRDKDRTNAMMLETALSSNLYVSQIRSKQTVTFSDRRLRYLKLTAIAVIWCVEQSGLSG